MMETQAFFGNQLKQIAGLIKDHEPELAISLAEEIIVSENASEDVRTKATEHAANAHMKLGQVQAAYRLSQRIDLKNHTLAARIGGMLVQQGSLSEASDILRRMPATDVAREGRTLLRARIAYKSKRFKEAETSYLEVREIGSSIQRTKSMIFLARIAHHMGDGFLANDRWRIVLEEDETNKEALNYLIRSAIQDEDLPSAQALFASYEDKIAPIDRVLLRAKIEPDRAAEILLEASREYPKDQNLQLEAAAEFSARGEHETARDCLDRALQLDPGNLLALRRMLTLLEQIRADSVTVLNHLANCLNHWPLDAGFLVSYGRCLMKLGRREEALTHFYDAVDKSPDAIPLWRYGAQLLVNENRIEEAAEFVERARSYLQVEDFATNGSFADVLRSAGRLDEADTIISNALDNDPGNTQFLESSIGISMERGDYHKAAERCRAIDKVVHPRRTPAIALAGAQCATVSKWVEETANVRGDGLTEDILDALLGYYKPDDGIHRNGIVHLTSSLGPGGAERQVSVMLPELLRNSDSGFEPSLVLHSSDPQYSRDFFLPDVLKREVPVVILEDEANGGSVRRFVSSYPEFGPKVRLLGALPPSLRQVALPFFVHLIKNRPKAVHLWQDAICVAGGIAAVAADVPALILSTRSTRPVEVRRFRPYLKSCFSRFAAMSDRTKILNNSRHGAMDYADWLGLEPSQINVIHNGFEFDEIDRRTKSLHPDEVRNSLGIPLDGKVIGGVMRFSDEKRPGLWLDTVIDLCRRDPSFYGVLAGDGPMRQRLQLVVEDHGLLDRIHLVGKKSPIEPYMAAMDLLFLSSETEGFPNVLVEAQSVGTAVATLDVGGAAEAVSPGNSCVIQTEKSSEISDKILELFQDMDALREKGGLSAAYVRENYSISRIGAQVREYYASL